MSLGPATKVINGQRFDLPLAEAYYPRGYGPQTVGVPQVSPTLPPFLGGAPGAGSYYSSIGGYGTADNNAAVAATAAAHPYNWKVSPLWWAVIGLVISLLLLQKIHWRKTILQGEERIGIGRESERAEVTA